MSSIKVYFKTFGCRVNQYETQVIRERTLADRAAEAVDWASADVCVINTCTVTGAADREALALIRRIARRNPAARLVVTGCLATRDREAVERAAPSAVVLGNAEKDAVPAALGCSPAGALAGVAGLAGHSRAFVKVQDGCNMHCAFCVIPSIRPSLWSKPFPALEAEAGALASRHAEIVLCGIRLGRYLSRDGAGRRVDFVGMLERLAALPGDFRIRLSSLEITDVTDRLIDCVAASGRKICPSLHSPLQSGSETVLRRMGRWYSAAFFSRRLEAARAAVPGLAVYTDVIAGFPGETEAEFDETLRFLESGGFAGLHVFRYSRRPGTAAARLPGLPEEVAARRAEELRGLDRRLREASARRAVGGLRWAAAESARGLAQGLSEDFLTLTLDRPLGPGLTRVRVVRAEGRKAYALPEPNGPCAAGEAALK